MPKQNFGSGLEKTGPPRQGEKGGKGGIRKKAGASEFGGNRTQKREGDAGRQTRNKKTGQRGRNSARGNK